MGDKKKILAVDDNEAQLIIYNEMLSDKYDLRIVKSASEAIHFLNGSKMDVILLDIEMPNISGFEFLSDIRSIPSYIGVPIIIISGNSGQDFLDKARNSSAFDVLTKPVRADDLISTIENAIAGNV
jgi:CheY-like chemotaxis protein